MKTVRALHEEAMTLAQQALALRDRGLSDEARNFAARAYHLEAQAAALVSKEIDSEPTRSILYQSASSLALDAGEIDEAYRLASEGLAGWPPVRTRDQLEETMDQVKLRRRFRLNAQELQIAEMQLYLDGNEVVFGKVPWSVLDSRMTTLMSMVSRTTRRLTGEKYRRLGGPSAAAKSFVPVISALQPGSFSVNVQITHSAQGQQSLFVTPEQIVDEVVEGAELVNQGRFDDLFLRIGERGYFNQFVSSAQALAPDGERVKHVGLSSAKTQVDFAEVRADDAEELPEYTGPAVTAALIPGFKTRLEGVLDQASVRGADQVGVTTAKGANYTLWVREGMDDIVRKHFNRRVEVRIEVADDRQEIVSVKPLEG